jgi:hypothetical protein
VGLFVVCAELSAMLLEAATRADQLLDDPDMPGHTSHHLLPSQVMPIRGGTEKPVTMTMKSLLSAESGCSAWYLSIAAVPSASCGSAIKTTTLRGFTATPAASSRRSTRLVILLIVMPVSFHGRPASGLFVLHPLLQCFDALLDFHRLDGLALRFQYRS